MITEDEAIRLASQFQRDCGRTANLSSVRRIGQEKIDAFVEAHGKPDPADCPDWMKPLPHWAVLFEIGWGGVPAHWVISVYDDGSVADMPIL
jgi:hypothetical protein